ncbi:MAG: DUF4115 domain-containing protein [Alphaproteobacteria bacterium]|nr:DUF4115 domain-containing protein [Alphaproteobacteria bacterium]
MANDHQRGSDLLTASERPRLNLRAPGQEDGLEQYGGIGMMLRQERERLGYDLPSVAAQLRIRYPYLEAIERGAFNELPGRIYVTGFLKTYADFLGLDQKAVLDAFAGEERAEPVQQRLVFPTPTPETHSPRGWLIVISLLVAGLIYGGWYYYQNRDRQAVDLVQPVPERMEQSAPPIADPAARASQEPAVALPAARLPSPQPAPNSAGEGNAGAGSPMPLPPAQMTPLPPALQVQPAPASVPPAAGDPIVTQPLTAPPAAATTPAEAPRAEVNPPPSAPPASQSDGQVYGVPAARSRVTLRAHGDSWIDVRSQGNEAVFPNKVLRAGDVYHAPDRSDLVLWTGNLGALEFVVDGVPLPRQGQLGEARRGISLDPGRLQAGSAFNR